MKTIKLQRETHYGENRLTIRFDYDTELISLVKKMEGISWSSTMNYWHLPDKPSVKSDLFNLVRGKAYLDYSGLNCKPDTENVPEINELKKEYPISERDRKNIDEFRIWMGHKRYSESTITTYTAMLGHFFKFISPKESSEVEAKDMVRFVDEYILPNGLSYTFQNQEINATKLYFKNIFKADFDVETFERPRREHRLPNVLSKNILESHVSMKSIQNIKSPFDDL